MKMQVSLKIRILAQYTVNDGKLDVGSLICYSSQLCCKGDGATSVFRKKTVQYIKILCCSFF